MQIPAEFQRLPGEPSDHHAYYERLLLERHTTKSKLDHTASKQVVASLAMVENLEHDQVVELHETYGQLAETTPAVGRIVMFGIRAREAFTNRLVTGNDLSAEIPLRALLSQTHYRLETFAADETLEAPDLHVASRLVRQLFLVAHDYPTLSDA